MKNPIIKYGLYSSVFLVIMFIISFLVFKEGTSGSELFGYSAMLLSMIFVFLGIRQYREEVGKGSLSFWQGFKTGLQIVSFPSLSFGLFTLLYVTVINPEFTETYYAKMIEKTQVEMTAEGATPETIEEKLAKMASEKEFFTNPFMQFLVMGATVFLIGIVASLISSFVLKKEPKASFS